MRIKIIYKNIIINVTVIIAIVYIIYILFIIYYLLIYNIKCYKKNYFMFFKVFEYYFY